MKPLALAGLVLALALAGCGDDRSPSIEAFCIDQANVMGVALRMSDLIEDGQVEPATVAQMLAALESARRHAPDDILPAVAALQRRWEAIESVLSANQFDLSLLSEQEATEILEENEAVVDLLQIDLAGWARLNC